MLAIRLDARTEKRLADWAKRTGRTKTSHAREAIIGYLADLEDSHLATIRLQQPDKTFSADEVKRELGLFSTTKKSPL